MPPDMIQWMERIDRIPSLEALRISLGVAFRSTLTSDEGRPTTFRIVLVERALAVDSKWVAVVLAEPRQLSVNAVRGIAPAASATNSFIAVEETDAGLTIWGIVRVGQPDINEVRLPGVVIRGFGPGRLTVTSANSELLVVGPDGAFLLRDERPSTFNFASIIGDALGLAGKPFATECAALLKLGLALRTHGHGGSLLVVESGSSKKHGTRLKYEVDDAAANVLTSFWKEYREHPSLPSDGTRWSCRAARAPRS